MLRRLLTATAQGFFRISTLGCKTEFAFSRHAMYNSLRDLGKSLPNRTGDVLAISHSTHLCPILGIVPRSTTEANYPEFNIVKLPFADGSFDFVLSDQVFEHIEGNPQQAIDETARLLRPGGIMVHTTCFQLPYHGPGDFWRYSPEGLAYLCRDVGSVLLSTGWGHPLVPLMNFLGFTRLQVPTAKWHPIHYLATVRWPSYDSLVWVVAQKKS